MRLQNIILPCALCAAALTSCSSDKKAETTEEAKPAIKIQNVTARDVDQTSTYTATVEAETVNNISAAMANRIKAIYVDEGYQVAKGQKLVELDDVNSTTYQLQLDNAKAALATTQADYDRAVELLKIGGGTKQAVDQMETQLINAKNAVASAERALRNVRENTVLTSPVSGVVTARNYDPGDMTGALPILTVSQVKPVKVVVNVTESELPNVKKGMPANITFETYGDEVFTGNVTMVGPTIEPTSRTFAVEITLPNSDGRILPGMFARVSMTFGQQSHVVVPDLAVVKMQGSGQYFVYVYKDGKVSYNHVELGRRIGDAYEVLSGVEPGSDVVVSGQSKLRDGAEVEVIK